LTREDQGNDAIVRRKQAQSGVDYADAVTIYETRDTIILFRPWYIPHHTRPAGLAGKLEKWRKGEHGLQVGVTPVTELSLDEDAVARLLDALERHSAVASGAGVGDYAVVRLTEGSPQLPSRNPAALARAFASLLTNREVLERFSAEELEPALVDALRWSLRVRELRLAVDELATMLDDGIVEERKYQAWCEQHSWAFGLGYVDRDDFRRISAGDDLDLLLPAIVSGYRDIAELKRPDHAVLRYDSGHKSYHWSPETSTAIGQSSRYLDVLHEEARKGLRDRPEVVAWHPRAIIVIGRSAEWSDEEHRALWALNDRLHSLEVTTYDHLLARGRRLIEILDRPEAAPAG
jgi:hypothetical protein